MVEEEVEKEEIKKEESFKQFIEDIKKKIPGLPKECRLIFENLIKNLNDGEAKKAEKKVH